MLEASRIITFLAVAGALLSGAHAISAVTRSGRYLYSGGNRFYIKGIAYQPQGVEVASANNPFLSPSTFVDPLANSTACARDLPYLQQLGVNAIRVYSVNSSLNHDSCMQAFSNAGIYTIIDLSLPVNGSIESTSPAWTTNLLGLYVDTIDAFSKYDNVLAYNVGNEVITSAATSNAAPFVKAAARDIKAYLTSQKSSVMVGYAAIDGTADWLDPFAEYLSCDPSGSNSASTSIDLFGLNNYQWCGNSSFAAAYADTEAQFQNYNVAAYFSEYGCASVSPRPWTEVGALFSSEMSPVWSGGLAFSYFPATSAAGSFGMVTINADDTVTTSQDFTNLKTEYAAASPPNTPTQSNAGSATYPSCPAQNATFLASTSLPQTPNLAACTCLESTLSCSFTPQVSNTSAIVGTLLNYACSALGSSGGNCDAIAANGTSGTYGVVSACDPSIMLSYVMNEYYYANGASAQACSFSGNGTVNAAAPSGTSAQSSAASSCLASASGTFTPTSSGGTTSSGGQSSGAASIVGDTRALVGLGAMLTIGAVSGVWILA
ncbi:glycoside hydrolase family 72 protein [Serpula lacrymans var. lacrymans S7.9]|uniref:1,3-beta-glucanosyltransferase n=1 Tax=Serpula lacrymans var. lacrymans (strain S7.9) TaxID=578457 RepID=F8NH87_SERL9|nr:glycoside hydrolase family 72 protein [Serpula lacrymans var. lacrymans S7.9]EGO29676.1 glycoside hydrolase family 72 protein [Serpula lacrymans var. lacrymans S7.9]